MYYNVKLVEVCDRIASGLSPRYYLSTHAIIWDYSGGDTFCQRCGGCGMNNKESSKKMDAYSGAAMV